MPVFGVIRAIHVSIVAIILLFSPLSVFFFSFFDKEDFETLKQ